MSVRLLLPIALATVVAACSKPVDEPTSDFKPSVGTPPPAGPTKLEIDDIGVGKGPVAKEGDTVHVQYTGTLMNGTKFDSSYDHGSEPFKFTIGKGEVIKGWDQGVVGMTVGGIRRLRIPPDLGYGASGSPPTIPPNTALVFQIELVSID